MPATSPSLAMLKNAAQVALETGCAVEIDKATGNVRILPPEAIPAHIEKAKGNSCDELFE
ncbi:hypothetical protein [Roseovarius confluentis]|uniref:hypothetical protein n=1 Tax=Roseovarius confluentis TaxID=1852027 RepID=UPI003BA85AE0